MRMPFVFRSTYDAALGREQSLLADQREASGLMATATDRIEDYRRICETRDEIIAGYKQQVADERAEKRDLLARFTQLRVMGVIDSTPPLPPSPVQSVDELEELIASVCGNNDRLMNAMLRQLAMDRENERPEDEIRDEILNGRRVSADEGLPA